MPGPASTTIAKPGLKAKLRPRAGGLATALFLGGLAVSGATALLVGPATEPAEAQTSLHDQPTAGTQPEAGAAR